MCRKHTKKKKSTASTNAYYGLIMIIYAVQNTRDYRF